MATGSPARSRAPPLSPPDPVPTGTPGVTRLDKWLWAARIFKTRQLATNAVSGGHVELNGIRTKPAHKVREGDILRIRKGAYTWELVVQGLADRRGPASVAQTLYLETEGSVQAREKLAQDRKTLAAQILYDTARPNRREQRRARMRKRKQ